VSAIHASLMTTRRSFLQTASGLVGTALVLPGLTGIARAADAPPLKLGLDNFAVRAMGWKAKQLIDYAAEQQCDTLFITDLDALESLEPGPLEEVKAHAAAKQIELLLGTWSICPTSKRFRDKWGTASEHLRLGIRTAKALGSPVLRVVLGSWEDRKTEGGIRARIADSVKVLKECRDDAVAAGIKLAMENHAGDLLAHELVDLVEQAGSDFVGVNFDSGNAVWTFEDPLYSLKRLGKYTLTTSLRDSWVWESENGLTVQWTSMGDGYVDWKEFFALFAKLCPNVAVNIETISGFNRELPLFQPDFAAVYKEASMAGLAPILKAAEKGEPHAGWSPPAGVERAEAEKAAQREQLERSLKYCREVLGMGRKGRAAS
jgi:sugar phosphate isomerase/epimerase